MAFEKTSSGTYAGVPQVTEIQDPAKFQTQKLVHVELLEPGLQVFATPQLAEQQTQLVIDHLNTPSVVQQLSPIFSSIPVVGSIYQAARQFLEEPSIPPAVQLQQNITRAREALRETSSTGSVIPPATSGRASPELPPIFGGGSPASSVAMMRLAELEALFSGNQVSRMLSARGLRWPRLPVGRRLRRRVRRIFPWGVME